MPEKNAELSQCPLLILAPSGSDAELCQRVLHNAGITVVTCGDVEELANGIRGGADGVLLSEEALTPEATARLKEELEKQPPWSELPLIIFTEEDTLRRRRSFEELTHRANVTLIDRPVRIQTLVSTSQSVLRARARQYDLRDLLAQLEQRVVERDHFLAMLGHELRNPLAAILLAAEATDPAERNDVARALKIVRRQSRRLRRLVDDLLDVARVTSGKIILQLVPLDLREVVAESAEPLREDARLNGLRLELQSGDHPVNVHGDAIRLEQVISNLLTNAIKYTEEGSITLTVESVDNQAVLRVRDTGIGLAGDTLNIVFDMFAQVDSSLDRSRGGMGLGLTLTRNLVELHGGTIEAHSEGPGRGSEFIVRLPLVDEALPCSDRPNEARGEIASKQIVVVEDNQDIRELLKAQLRKLGHEVHAAEDGASGIRLIMESKAEVALIDIGLPGIDGYEVARRARANGGNLFLIALTGYGLPEDKERAIKAGFDEHLTKPIDVEKLWDLLRSIQQPQS